MNASDYRPIFNTHVTEKYLNANEAGGYSKRDPSTIHPQYCLMPASARCLATLFAGTAVGVPEVFMAPPIKQAKASHFASAFNMDVPWLRFTVGGQTSDRNAGLLAIYWGTWDLADQTVRPMPGVPYSESLNEAVIDVQTEVGGQ